ncbi:class I SAM-dependent methyltransferase [Rhodococcoides navarretei]|uniref:S-adenosyl-L-methionine-dependent methyltransferase n=1 Tax=Rhodococcus navarretei TaxID=3128981 RepID=A0ABU9CS95_9NOCA
MTTNAISRTAFFCCGIRAQDATSPHPICEDTYAEGFMTDEGRAILARFAGTKRRNVSNVVRARMIQDDIDERLQKGPEIQVVNIGAGFDSRAYRLTGGRWFEFDEPAIIDHKNSRLPTSSCPNPLRRIAVDFSAGDLPIALQQCDPDAETLVVIEGVFMYLEAAEVIDLLGVLADAFGRHTLICDLMDKVFFDKHIGKLYDQILALGTEFKFLEPEPERIFLDHGYLQPDTPRSIVGRARELGAVAVPAMVFNTVLRSLRDGYRIHTFTAASSPRGQGVPGNR